MPFHIRKFKTGWRVYDDKGKSYSKKPLSKKTATAQLRALYANIPEARTFRGSGYCCMDKDLYLDGDGFFSDFFSKVKDVAKGVISRVKGVSKGIRQGFQPKARSIFDRYGDYIITNIFIRRKPIFSILDKFLNLLSLGKWNEAKAKYGYDSLFHLSMVFVVRPPDRPSGSGGVQYIKVEKNEVPDVEVYNYRQVIEQPYMQFGVPCCMTLNQVMNNAQNMMGEKFYTYDAFQNNCQVFIQSILKASGLLTDRLNQFIMQDTEGILKQLPGYIQPLSRKITDIAGLANVALEGQGKDVIKMTAKDFIAEHKKLVALLNETSGKLNKEAKEQAAEAKAKTGVNVGGKAPKPGEPGYREWDEESEEEQDPLDRNITEDDELPDEINDIMDMFEGEDFGNQIQEIRRKYTRTRLIAIRGFLQRHAHFNLVVPYNESGYYQRDIPLIDIINQAIGMRGGADEDPRARRGRIDTDDIVQELQDDIMDYITSLIAEDNGVDTDEVDSDDIEENYDYYFSNYVDDNIDFLKFVKRRNPRFSNEDMARGFKELNMCDDFVERFYRPSRPSTPSTDPQELDIQDEDPTGSGKGGQERIDNIYKMAVDNFKERTDIPQSIRRMTSTYFQQHAKELYDKYHKRVGELVNQAPIEEPFIKEFIDELNEISTATYKPRPKEPITDAITLDDIDIDKDIVIDTGDEALQNRYYTFDTMKELATRGATNPFTRDALNKIRRVVFLKEDPVAPKSKVSDVIPKATGRGKHKSAIAIYTKMFGKGDSEDELSEIFSNSATMEDKERPSNPVPRPIARPAARPAPVALEPEKKEAGKKRKRSPEPEKKEEPNKKPISGKGIHSKFAKQLTDAGIDPKAYLKKARAAAKKAGYDGRAIEFADDGKHKLMIYDDKGNPVKFGAVSNKDFIIYSATTDKANADKKRKAYLARATKIKGDWKKDKFSPNNLAISVLW